LVAEYEAEAMAERAGVGASLPSAMAETLFGSIPEHDIVLVGTGHEPGKAWTG